MNPAGGVLIIAGLWIVCQVFGGRALQRLGVVEAEPDGGTITGRGQVLPGTITGRGQLLVAGHTS